MNSSILDVFVSIQFVNTRNSRYILYVGVAVSSNLTGRLLQLPTLGPSQQKGRACIPSGDVCVHAHTVYRSRTYLNGHTE